MRSVGSASTTSRVNTFGCPTLCTSTTGALPCTVTISVSAPGANCEFTFAVKSDVSSTPARLTVPKLASEKVTA